MKTFFIPYILTMLAISSTSFGQDSDPEQFSEQDRERHHHSRKDRYEEHRIKTIFNNHGPRSSGGYIALSNKFTSINSDFANLVEIYGGWYINHRFLIGIGGAATTNHIPVPLAHSVNPLARMSYEYMQAGLMTEYVIGSDRAVHLAVQLFVGGGGTLQYERYGWEDEDYWDDYEDFDHDENVFAVAEPGVRVEVNVFRWLRFSPGVSYRMTYGSDGKGLSDNALEGTSVNMTLKIGKF